MTNKPDIKYLFEPRSVAVIGASHNRQKIGYRILENIISGDYTGSIYPINPKGGEILGLKVYESLDDVNGRIDVAVIAIPARIVPDALKACARKGVMFVPVISSGFSEIGNNIEEKKIVEYAQENGMRILGPNIFGLYSANSSLNATFGQNNVRAGDVAIITQSGALGISMMGKTTVENIGLSAMVSVGNKSDIDEADLLGYLVKDDNTKIILMYIEGVHEGEQLISALKHTTKRKPVIVIKSGRSKRGAMAAASHTGSLAGSDKIFSGIMKQCGSMRSESIQEALRWCKFMSYSSQAKGENTVIITNGGGMGVLAADACEKYGVSLYDNIPSMKKIFSNAVPRFGSVKNPIDITGQAKIENYENAIKAALNSDEIHSIICLGCETAFFEAEKLSLMIKKMFHKSRPPKPIVFSFFGGGDIEDAITHLKSIDLPVFSDVYAAVSCLGALHNNYRNQTYRVDCDEDIDYSELGIDTDALDDILKKVQEEDRIFLFPYEAHDVMNAAGIKTTQSRVAHNIDEAIRYAEELGYPVAMKVVSKDIIHKSDAGGVVLNIDNQQEIMDAYEAITYNCKKHKPDAHIEGVEIAKMAADGVEIIAGAVRDKSFGPVVMVGLGGVYVEVMDDVSFRAFPLSKRELNEMISEIKAYRLLLGVRGEKKKDINSLADTIIRIGFILKRYPEISDIEINPLIVYDENKGVRALDVRILLSKKKEVNK